MSTCPANIFITLTSASVHLATVYIQYCPLRAQFFGKINCNEMIHTQNQANQSIIDTNSLFFCALYALKCGFVGQSRIEYNFNHLFTIFVLNFAAEMFGPFRTWAARALE
jgi:hypothetical protein